MVPAFNEFMKPLLEMCLDGNEHTLDDARNIAVQKLNLSKEDQEELLPSQVQRTFDNRVQWAKSYLIQAKCLESSGRGRFKITDRGIELANQNHATLNQAILRQYDEFKKFSRGDQKDNSIPGAEIESTIVTPDEELFKTVEIIEKSAMQSILEKVYSISHKGFEYLVVDLMSSMGYGKGTVNGGPNDEGIDGIINQDTLGVNKIYLQAKHYKSDNGVASEEIQKFAGALSIKGVLQGVFITSSYFTRPATELIKQFNGKIIAIDGEKLSELMYSHNVGVSIKKRIEIKKIDSDYFDEYI